MAPRDHQPSHPGVEKLHALTGLRFAAAAMIVVHHSRGVLGVSKTFLEGWPLNTGVSFFFVLSGFILAHVYPSLEEPGAVRKFFAARFARIWPAHLFTFLIVLAPGLHSKIHGTGFTSPFVVGLVNVAMLQAMVPASGYFFSFNALSWSVSTEFFFYLAFPFLIRQFARTWWWKMALALLISAALIAAGEIFHVAPFADAAPFQINRAGLLYINPFGRIAEFILGMTTVYWWKRSVRNWRLAPAAATFFEALCVLGCIGCLYLSASRAKLPGNDFFTHLRHAGTAPAFALLIMVFASQQGYLSRFFATRGLILLGEISFSLYLLHTIVLGLSSKWKNHLLQTGFNEGLLYLAFWIVLLVASWTVWRWIERPARATLLRLAHVSWGRGAEAKAAS